jgi:hypothetical protein
VHKTPLPSARLAQSTHHFIANPETISSPSANPSMPAFPSPTRRAPSNLLDPCRRPRLGSKPYGTLDANTMEPQNGLPDHLDPHNTSVRRRIYRQLSVCRLCNWMADDGSGVLHCHVSGPACMHKGSPMLDFTSYRDHVPWSAMVGSDCRFLLPEETCVLDLKSPERHPSRWLQSPQSASYW